MSAMSGRNSLLCRSGLNTGRAARRSMFGTYVGKYGLKTRQPSPGLRKASQKNCSKTFAPGPTMTLDASAGMSNSSRTNLAAASRNGGIPGDGQ